MIKIPEDKVIITVALTGAMADMRKINPNLPEQPEQQAAQAYDCYNEGATIVHLHARDKEGNPTGSKDVFRSIHEQIRKKCNIIIQDSTGGGMGVSIEQRTECLEAQPEMASLNMGSLVRTWGKQKGTAWVNTRDDIEAFVTRMNQFGIKPEMEVYGLAMFREVYNLVEKGLVQKPYYIDLILGMAYQGAHEADPRYFSTYLQYLPPDSIFNSLGVGTAQAAVATLGMINGGCCRVGMEDNLYYKKGELVKNNAQLVARIVRIARELGKEPATPDEGRQILGLKPLKK